MLKYVGSMDFATKPGARVVNQIGTKAISVISTLALLGLAQGCSSYGGDNAPVAPRVNSAGAVVQPLFTSNTVTATPTPVATPVPTPPPMKVMVSSFLSDEGTQVLGGNINSSSTVSAVLVSSTGAKACTISDPSIKSSLINQQALVINNVATSCPNLAAGKYSLQLVGSNTQNLLFGLTGQQTYDQRMNIYSGMPAPSFSVLAAIDPASHIMALTNAQGIIPTVMMNSNSTMGQSVNCTTMAPTSNNGDPTPTPTPGTATPTGQCTVMASPLLVQIGKNGSQQSIDLSAPLSGVLFDILGSNSFPFAHAKKIISWFTQETVHGNYFIVLPDSNGEVNGVDQMFGNNTRGPDGEFAANGYDALKKWDGRKADGSYDSASRNGVIDRHDAVFSQLRLWEDDNGDGIAQASELHTLSEVGLTSIDLSFDASYTETDSYGNQIRMRSSATTSDSKRHVVYDIWFRIVPQ